LALLLLRSCSCYFTSSKSLIINIRLIESCSPVAPDTTQPIRNLDSIVNYERSNNDNEQTKLLCREEKIHFWKNMRMVQNDSRLQKYIHGTSTIAGTVEISTSIKVSDTCAHFDSWEEPIRNKKRRYSASKEA
jgi:hypothetical protein